MKWSEYVKKVEKELNGNDPEILISTIQNLG